MKPIDQQPRARRAEADRLITRLDLRLDQGWIRSTKPTSSFDRAKINRWHKAIHERLVELGRVPRKQPTVISSLDFFRPSHRMPAQIVQFDIPGRGVRATAGQLAKLAAEERMAHAWNLLAGWRYSGKVPGVRWGVRVAIVDLRTGRDLKAPSWARMELLWLLRVDELPHVDMLPIRQASRAGGVA